MKRRNSPCFRYVFYVIALTIFAGVFVPAIGAAQEPKSQDYELVSEIPYPNDGTEYARERCKLDLYLPKVRENFPVLVWFHGGALKFSSKNDIYAVNVAKRFASEGIGVVLPNYRLSPRVKYPSYIEDAARAVAWIYHNISSYHGNPKQLFIGGHSAGAYLAAMIGVDERYLKQHQLSLQQIVGVIPLSGQMNINSTVQAERGIPHTTIVDESAPMFYTDSDAPPWLCMCGENDNPGICEQNRKFAEALRTTGHEHVTFKEFHDRNHFSISAMKAPDDPVVKRMLSFMQAAIAGE